MMAIEKVLGRFRKKDLGCLFCRSTNLILYDDICPRKNPISEDAYYDDDSRLVEADTMLQQSLQYYLQTALKETTLEESFQCDPIPRKIHKTPL
jgi:hypothetical protein